jgi:hypothetical protein
MSLSKGDFEECPCCQGEGDIEDNECQFCDGYGFLILSSIEYDETMTNGWDELDYTTYLTYLRGSKRRFRHYTNEVVIDTEIWETFFDEPAPPIQYLTIEGFQRQSLLPA